MKLPSLIGVASLSILCLGTVRADPTAPVDFSHRNGTFAPAVTVVPEKNAPVIDAVVQDKRIEKQVLDRPLATMGEQRAPIVMQEAREKQIRSRTATRPEAATREVSNFNHRLAPFTTANAATTTSVVSKYQDGLKAASAANMARFPALDRSTTAKFNRFVFRKNSPNPAPVMGGAPGTRAGGGPPDAASAKSGSPIRN